MVNQTEPVEHVFQGSTRNYYHTIKESNIKKIAQNEVCGIDNYCQEQLITQANRFVWIISIVTFILAGFALTEAQDASNLREQNKVLKDNYDRATVINGINNGRLKAVNDYFNPTIDTLYRGQKIKYRKVKFNFGDN